MEIGDFLSKTCVLKTNCSGAEHVINGTYDSRRVSENYMFFDFNDGRYVSDARQRGATVVVSERAYDGFPSITVSSAREAFCVFCSLFYEQPEKDLKFIAVVGTNGKTSTVKIINHILNSCGFKTADIGTLGAEIDGVTYSTGMTTPDTDSFFKILNVAAEKKVDYIITELSAHAIFHKKLANIVFDYCIFTNATPDHLDFFSTMEEYISVKESIFINGNVKCAVINADDDTGVDIIKKRCGKTLTYGIYNPSDTFAINRRYMPAIECVVNSCDNIAELVTPLCGEFNLYNILAAISVCVDIGVDIEKICTALSTVPAIDGRYNVLYGKATVIIDYAHTPDGLLNVLTTARKNTKKRLIAVFGCGGNRDRQKRPAMGRIASELCDFVIVTSDNPRDEDPQEIIDEIVSGMDKDGKNYRMEPDREIAIKTAIDMAASGDTVVIAGKGAEAYMEIKGKKIHFSDKEICERLLGRKQ